MFSSAKTPLSHAPKFLTSPIFKSFQGPPAHLRHQFIQSSTTTPYNLIVLHGLVGSSNNFRSLVSNPTIKSKVNSYLLDLRNHGFSEHKPTMEIQEMAADVVNFVTQKSLKNLIIMGHSLGGKVLMSMATAFPEIYPFVKAIIIMDIAPINYHKDPNRKHPKIDETLNMLRGLNLIDMGNKSYNELRKEVLGKCPTKEIGELIWTNIDHDKEHNIHKWKINLPVIVEYYNKILEFVPNTEKSYEGIIKVLRGSKSQYIMEDHYKNFTDIFKTLNPQTDIITIKDSDHWIHFEKPYDVIKEISEIIDKVKANDK